MADKFSNDLLARLQVRAGRAERQNDFDEMAANSESADEALASLSKSNDPELRAYLAGTTANSETGDGSQTQGLFEVIGRAFGGRSMLGMMAGVDGRPGIVSFGGEVNSSQRPASPCDEGQVAAAEAQLGFCLPGDLRQFYLEVSDGGVGPGNGVYSLEALLAKWREFTHEPIGPHGQQWPKDLLPIHGENWDATCIHRQSGKLIYWDVEEMEYGGWDKSFKDEADGLEVWLEKWLNQESLVVYGARCEERQPQQLTDDDWQAWGELCPENREYLRRLDIFGMTEAERAAIGLPESGWEDKVWEGFDLTRIDPPTPGFAARAHGAGR